MINPETRAPHTAHTTNPVPFIITGGPTKFKFITNETKEKSNPGSEEGEEDGALCDVAPTILAIMVSLKNLGPQ